MNKNSSYKTNPDEFVSYKDKPKKAFMDQYVHAGCYRSIEDVFVADWTFFMPRGVAKRAGFLRKYFKLIDSQPEEKDHKRRDNWALWASTTLLMLSRLDSCFTRKSNFILGSQSVSPIAWATVGETERIAQNKFTCLVDISRYYRNFLHGDCLPVLTYFKETPSSLFKLADRFPTFPLSNPNFWMGVAICLTYDLIHNCGPDCPQVFELFTNDSRIGPGDMPYSDWEKLRCKILGVKGNPLRDLPGPYTMPVYEPVCEKYKVEIMMLDVGDDLAEGTRTIPLKRPPEPEKPILCLPPAKIPNLPSGLCHLPIPDDMLDNTAMIL